MRSPCELTSLGLCLLHCKKLLSSSSLMNTLSWRGDSYFSWQTISKCLGLTERIFTYLGPCLFPWCYGSLRSCLLWWAMPLSFFLKKKKKLVCKVVCSISLRGVGRDVATSPSSYLADLLCRSRRVFFISQTILKRRRDDFSYLRMRLNSTLGCEAFRNL